MRGGFFEMTTRKPNPRGRRVAEGNSLQAQGERVTDDHPRNTAAMLSSPRCGAKTRNGGACRSPAVHGKKRCRMHGGAPGSGAPKGNKNALKHGLFTKEAIEQRKQQEALEQEIVKRRFATTLRLATMKWGRPS
jgi:hypothetical protein